MLGFCYKHIDIAKGTMSHGHCLPKPKRVKKIMVGSWRTEKLWRNYTHAKSKVAICPVNVTSKVTLNSSHVVIVSLLRGGASVLRLQPL